jgi:Ca2+-transporting ATPase
VELASRLPRLPYLRHHLGLPLAVTLALAFATKRMTKENLLVRVLGSCETMANASVICTDKTGTLTQNSMTVVAGCLGIHAKFVRQLNDNAARSNAEEMEQSTSGPEQIRKHYEDFSIDQANLTAILSPQLRELLSESIAVNSSAFQDIDPETGEKVFIGSKTETALLQFAHELGCRDYKETRDAAVVIQMIPFSSERKFMGVVVRLSSGKFRLYAKGASEILSKECAQHVVIRNQKCETGKVNEEVEVKAIDDLARDNISRTIIFYANQTLRTIALCYKDFESWPPLNTHLNEEGEVRELFAPLLNTQ